MYSAISLIAQSLNFAWQLMLKKSIYCFSACITFLLISIALLFLTSRLLGSEDITAFSNSIPKVFGLLPIVLMAFFSHQWTLNIQKPPQLFKIIYQFFIQNFVLLVGLGLLNAITDWMLLRGMMFLSTSFTNYLELVPKIINQSASQEAIDQFTNGRPSVVLVFTILSGFVSLFFMIALVIGNVKSFSLLKTLFYSVVVFSRSLLVWLLLSVISGAIFVHLIAIAFLLSAPLIFLSTSFFAITLIIFYFFALVFTLISFAFALYYILTQVLALKLNVNAQPRAETPQR